MEHTFSCSQCGSCIRDCVWHAIQMTEDGVRIILDRCLKCGHCTAVCPTDEMENPYSNRQPKIGQLPSAEDMARYLRAARSVRQYREELIPHEQMLELLDIGRYAQTGVNSQGISYLVVEGREKVCRVNELYCGLVERYAAQDPKLSAVLNVVKCQKETGEDIVFRGCPELILALADKDNIRGKANAQFSLTFIALLAPTLGVGTCWAGYFEKIAADDQYAGEILAHLKVPQDKRIRGVMMAGLPAVTYHRLVERDPLHVSWR